MLSDLDAYSDAVLVEIEIEKPEKLNRFLRRIAPYLGDRPVPARLDEMVTLLQKMGLPTIGGLAAPTIGKGAAA
jgi:hypothetical protein